MASTQTLSGVAQDRKSRLAQLKSLKRKQPDSHNQEEDEKQSLEKENGAQEHDTTSRYLSGRNYDVETKGAKLGFEVAPSEDQETLEKRAAALAEETKQQAEAEAAQEQPLDLFKLQPKKPNWDLRRDLDRKLEILNVRTDNAIARIVRERVAGQQKAAQAAQSNNGDGEASGLDGVSLLEATHAREREMEEESRRERDEDENDLTGESSYR